MHRLDRLAGVAGDHRDRADAGGQQRVQLPLQQRLAVQVDQALGAIGGEGQQTPALTGAQDDGLHGLDRNSARTRWPPGDDRERGRTRQQGGRHGPGRRPGLRRAQSLAQRAFTAGWRSGGSGPTWRPAGGRRSGESSRMRPARLPAPDPSRPGHARYRLAMILRRYLLRELASPFAVVCGSLLLVFTGYSSARFLGEAASGALPGSLAAVLIGLKLFISLDAIVPMALMLSVALGLGRLQRDQETTALAACGIGERWLFQAVLWLALPVAVVVATASLLVRPQLYQNVYRLEAGAERRFDLTRLPPGRFYADFTGGLVMFSEAADGDERLQVFTHADSGGQADGVVFAQRARQLTDPDGRQVVEFLERPLLPARSGHRRQPGQRHDHQLPHAGAAPGRGAGHRAQAPQGHRQRRAGGVRGSGGHGRAAVAHRGAVLDGAAGPAGRADQPHAAAAQPLQQADGRPARLHRVLQPAGGGDGRGRERRAGALAGRVAGAAARLRGAGRC